MSLHAQLSPEVLARLHAQQRNSTITSIIIAILVVLLVGVILLYLLLPAVNNYTPEIVSYQAGAENEDKITKREITRAVQRKPSAPSSSMAKVIAANTSSTTAIPIPEFDVPDPSTDFGNGDDFGDGWGSGESEGGGGGFSNIPATMRERCSLEDRLARLEANGGNEQCEEAVMKALRWLKKTQNADGSWAGGNKGAMTGFALLAFLGHCETPNSEEFGDAVTRAIVYLVNLGMKNDGRLATAAAKSHHWVYEHGIATYAIAEAYTFCNNLGLSLPNLGKVTKLAGDIIIKGQGESGGWVYSFKPTNSGDNSVGFWQIQALKACKHTKLWEDKDFKTVSRKALEWLDRVQGANGSIGYRNSPGEFHGLTGGGLLAFQMWGQGRSKNVRKGIKLISKKATFDWDTTANLYYHYYHAQAMINYGGKEWKAYNEMFRDVLLKNQNEDGTWQNKASKHSKGGVMQTCLATFMLEVYYRFLPATGSKTK
ncbi:MAG: terpene cyclase/mutase family protein [Verrucomicrobiae bacterium]|nr:terpene cyclase/mutase family protein [Verrucomicrobiae bacterium]NNJ42281.1 terpene cyclase/mutase family protein [Akkermansiaceae bacterium]